MTVFTRRLASALLATTMIAPFAAESSFAQSNPALAPAGGITSSTTPGGSEGTPSGGTGAVTTTRTAPAPMPTYQGGSTYADAPPPRRVRRRVRRARRPAPAATAPASTTAPMTTPSTATPAPAAPTTPGTTTR